MPPVFMPIIGVPPTKNSCWTMPPGSNLEGMRPKSHPKLSKGESRKNLSGAHHILEGYLLKRYCIFPIQLNEYYSL